MAGKKGNGHDKVTAEMVGLLREIRDEIRATNTRLDTLHDDVLDARAAFDGFREETRDAARRLENRVDKLTDRVDAMAMDMHRLANDDEVTRRLERLEEAVFKRAS